MSPVRERVPLLGVDAMAFVYHFEQNEEFGAAAEEVFRGYSHSRRSERVPDERFETAKEDRGDSTQAAGGLGPDLRSGVADISVTTPEPR